MLGILYGILGLIFIPFFLLAALIGSRTGVPAFFGGFFVLLMSTVRFHRFYWRHYCGGSVQCDSQMDRWIRVCGWRCGTGRLTQRCQQPPCRAIDRSWKLRHHPCRPRYAPAAVAEFTL